MNNKRKIKIFKIVLIILVILTLIEATVYLFPVMRNLSTTQGQIEFKQKVDESGMLGLLALFGLQVAQIFLFIVPGEPLEILAGMCYGALWGTVFIMTSASLISMVIFLLVRKYGRKFVYEFSDKNKIEKIENSKIFKNPEKIEFILLVLFLVPGTPKDLIVYLSGLLPIKPSRFFLITTFARFPSVICSTLAGKNLAVGDWKMGIILYALVLVSVGVIIFIINKFDKSAQEAVKTVLK